MHEEQIFVLMLVLTKEEKEEAAQGESRWVPREASAEMVVNGDVQTQRQPEKL